MMMNDDEDDDDDSDDVCGVIACGGRHCWETQHFRDRWRTLLSVDDMVRDIIGFLDTRGVLNETFVFYASDNGYKQARAGRPAGRARRLFFSFPCPPRL